jgi:hypothetical protein
VGGKNECNVLLNFQTVDMKKVIEEGAPLLRSGGEVKTIFIHS